VPEEERSSGTVVGQRLAVLFLLKRGRDGGVGGEADAVAFDVGDQAAGDVVVVVAVGAAVLLGQLDAVALDLVDVPRWTPSAPITSMCSLIPLRSAMGWAPEVSRLDNTSGLRWLVRWRIACVETGTRRASLAVGKSGGWRSVSREPG
jgi:hypothetical protein